MFELSIPLGLRALSLQFDRQTLHHCANTSMCGTSGAFDRFHRMSLMKPRSMQFDCEVITVALGCTHKSIIQAISSALYSRYRPF